MIPGSEAIDRLTDTYIDAVLEALYQADPGHAPGQTPYDAEGYAASIEPAVADLTFDALSDDLSHTTEDITVVAQTGLASLSQLETLYQKLYAHLFLPELHNAVIAIDQDLSQTTTPATIAEQSKSELERERSSVNLGYTEPVPDELEDYLVGPGSPFDGLTVADVERSSNQFADAYSRFETSLELLAETNHERSTAEWSEALKALYLAHQTSPLTR